MANIYRWYIVRVKPGSEYKILKVIEGGYKFLENFVQEVFMPMRGEDDKARLMPGYLFVKMSIDKIHLQQIKSIPSVIGFLTVAGSEDPQELAESEILKIKESVSGIVDDVCDTSSLLCVGDKVEIVDGPFQSFCGKIECVDDVKKLVKVIVFIFGRSTPIDLENHQVKKVN